MNAKGRFFTICFGGGVLCDYGAVRGGRFWRFAPRVTPNRLNVAGTTQLFQSRLQFQF